MPADPFCICGYRKSLHPNAPGECKRFVRCEFFNRRLPTDPKVADTEMEMT